MRTRLIMLVGLMAPLLAFAAVAWNRLLDQNGGSGVHFGAMIAGKEPFVRNANEAFAPASTSKLFTAGAALAKLGPDFRFVTLLRWEQQGARASHVQLVGGGDPTWGLPQFQPTRNAPRTYRLDEIARALREAGVTEIAGVPEALPNHPLWASISIPAGWKPSDTESCMGSLAQAFNFSQNCATYKVTGLSSGSWTAGGLRFPVEHQLRADSSTSIVPKPVRGSRGWRYLLQGTLKAGATASLTLPVLDTRPWAEAQFRESLALAGIRVVPTADDEPRRGDRKELRFLSPPLSEVLKPFLKNSNNFLGDAVLKALAGAAPGSLSISDDLALRAGILEASLEELRVWLLGLGLPREFILNDGSGLSRTSRVSPRFLLEFLERASGESWFPAFWEALAVAGVDGTLRNRMKGTAAAGKLRGKTGTLDGVYNLAGYVPNGMELVPFAVLTRTTSANVGAARGAEDRVGAALAALHASLPFTSFVEEAAPESYPYYPEQAGFDDQ